MMRIFTTSLLVLFCACNWAFAQKELTYAQKAAEIQTKVWGSAMPEFNVKTIPANLENESAVIIAQYTNVEQSTNERMKFAFYIPASATRTNRVTTFRERVKINDRAALDDYSYLSYQKRSDKTVGALYFKLFNKKDSYIGVKIIKPGGREVIVNTSEEVLTKNESKDTKGKLAIPGLEVGDILDYYITKVELVEGGNDEAANSKYVFLLGGEYPVMSYEANLQFNSKVYVSYINANGAPQFIQSTLPNGDKVYNVKMQNLGKLDTKLWSSPLREFPYLELGANFNNKYVSFMMGNLGAGNNANRSRLDNVLYHSYNGHPGRVANVQYADETKKYFGSGKELKEAPVDSVLRVLYDVWKYHAFCYYDGKDFDVSINRNARKANSLYYVGDLLNCIDQLNIDAEVDWLRLSPRTGCILDNVFDYDDIASLVKIRTRDTTLYMCIDDVFTQFNEIPESYQGEEAVVDRWRKLRVDKKDRPEKKEKPEKRTVIPITESKQNYVRSVMKVNLLATNLQKVKIERTVTEAGAMRDDQSNLLLMSDIDDAYTDLVNGPELQKRVDGGKKVASEYEDAFEKAKEENQTNFKNEISSEFGQDPQDLTDYKIINKGLNYFNPLFTYTGTFVFDNFVKKAGNNYIFEVGKLMGTYTKLDEKQRQRKTDIYMPAARTLAYDITVNIPKGYQVKGVDELNQQQKNATGELTVAAKVQGNVLTLKVGRVYTHNFEKVSEWPKLLELMDAFYNLNTQKVLFEKI